MLVSADQLSNYNIPSDLWFQTRTIRNKFFEDNPDRLISGLYVAICDDGTLETYTQGLEDKSLQVWDLEQYNGVNWQSYEVDENYNLIITTSGLAALANAVNGATSLSFSGIKIIDACLTNPATPLATWNDSMFSTAGQVVFSVGTEGDSTFVHHDADDLKSILTWRYNSGSGGLQYTITLPAEGLGSVSNTLEPIWNIGSIGLYVKHPETGINILFGIATLQTPAQKIGNDVNTIGNSMKFYINTVLTNLGYVETLNVEQEDECSIPQVSNETFLQYPVDTSEETPTINYSLRPYNLYLVSNLYGTGMPALAVQTQNPATSTSDIDWNYFQPSDTFLNVDPDYFASDVFNYAFVYWDPTIDPTRNHGLYKLAEGSTGANVSSGTSDDVNPKKPIGIRVGNNIVFSGQIGNPNATYLYKKPQLVNPGTGYSVNDQLLLLYAVNNNAYITFKIKVDGVDPSSKAIVNYTFVGPTSGNVLINAIKGTPTYKGTVNRVSDLPSINKNGDYYIVKNTDTTNVATTKIWQINRWVSSESIITAVYDPRTAGSARTGEGAQFSVTCEALAPASWNLTKNLPYYCGNSANGTAGLPVETQNDSFLGWATSTNSLRLGVDLRNEASYTVYGTTRYATNEETRNIVAHSDAQEQSSVTPKNLKLNYLQITTPSTSTSLNSLNSGFTSSNRATVDTYVSFNHTIVSNVTSSENNGVGFQGTSYRALWADLAEYYEADHHYEAGTLITFGEGDAEITAATTTCNGVISTNPGYQLGEKKNDNYQPVALCGRVPVLFDGHCKIKKGDNIYLSKLVKGRASTIKNGRSLGRVIQTDIGTMTKVECVVKISFD